MTNEEISHFIHFNFSETLGGYDAEASKWLPCSAEKMLTILRNDGFNATVQDAIAAVASFVEQYSA